jgi:hypothetical protein
MHAPEVQTSMKTDLRTASSRLTRAHAVIALAALAIFLLIARLPAYHEPLEWDVGTYSVVANEILHGERLYADVWDMKPPAIFATYTLAELVAGEGFFCVYLLSVITAIVTMLGIYRGAAVAGRAAGRWAAAAWAAMCFEPRIEGTAPNTEAFINAAIAWAFALWVEARVSERRAGWGRWIGIALLFALATMYKHVAAAPAVFMGLAEIAFPPKDGARTRIVLRLAMMALVALAAWGAVFGYFAATGRAWLAWETIVVAPRAYAGSILTNLLHSFMPGKGISSYLAYTIPAIVLTLIAVALRTKAAPRGAWVLFAGLAIGTHVAVALPGPFWSHYFQLWLVPLAIGAGWGAAALPMTKGMRSPRLATAATALAMLTMLYAQISWLGLTGDQRALKKYNIFFMWANEAARDAGNMLAPGETFYMWGDEAYGYVVAGRRPPAAGLWKSHTLTGPLAQWLTQRTVEDLDRHPPEMFLHWGDPISPTSHPIYQWSRTRYEPLPVGRRYFPMFLFYRKGGALERRLAATRPALTQPTTMPVATGAR